MFGGQRYAAHVKRRLVRRHRSAAAVCAALFGATACSSNGEVIATITQDAARRDVVNQCMPTFTENAYDMGLDLFFVMEHSTDNVEEWGPLVFGLSNVFSTTSLEFAGIGAGFTIYPARIPVPQSCVDACPTPNCSCLRNCGCSDPERDALGVCTCPAWPPSCDEGDYAPTFPLARVNETLPDNTVFSALGPTVSYVTTSADEPAMYPALLASLRYRNQWESQHPRRRITQVLVSKSLDFPDCADDRIDISDIEDVISGTDKPKTYVITVNASGDNDERDYVTLAEAGRTAAPRKIPFRPRTSPNLTSQFEEIVRFIRANDGRCEYLLPSRVAKGDYDKVNLTAGSGGLLYPKVPNREACASNDLGWYYEADDGPDASPEQPPRIVACEGACKTLHGLGTGGTARIQLGCPTVFASDAGR